MSKTLNSDFDIIIILVLAIGIVLLFTIFIITFLLIFQKRSFQHEKQVTDLAQNYQQELLKTQIEVQEQTLSYISQEIHDNIGQVLSFVKLTLGTVNNAKEEERKQKIDESRELIANSITDLRNLSKSLSFQHISEFGLMKSIQVEAERMNKGKLIDVELVTDGDIYSLGEQRELVLFRIFQEAINNTLKYAQARHLKIMLIYSEEIFNLTIADDGIGFSREQIAKGGAGLKNMASRAALIGAVTKIDSAPGKGCKVEVALNLFEQLQNHGKDSNSAN